MTALRHSRGGCAGGGNLSPNVIPAGATHPVILAGGRAGGGDPSVIPAGGCAGGRDLNLSAPAGRGRFTIHDLRFTILFHEPRPTNHDSAPIHDSRFTIHDQ